MKDTITITRAEYDRLMSEYGSQKIQRECIEVLTRALYPLHKDVPEGYPNTLWALVREACARLGLAEALTPYERRAKGVLEVGTNGRAEVVINHPDLKPDAHGVGHIVFSIEQCEGFIATLQRQVAVAKTEQANAHD